MQNLMGRIRRCAEDYNMICAGVIISFIPALILFIVCQKQIYNGIAAGAVKG